MKKRPTQGAGAGDPALTRAAEGEAVARASRRKPGPPCPVCRHPARDAVDLALAAGIESRAEVARKFGLDRTAAYRHAHGGHMASRMVSYASDAAADAADALLG